MLINDATRPIYGQGSSGYSHDTNRPTVVHGPTHLGYHYSWGLPHALWAGQSEAASAVVSPKPGRAIRERCDV